MVIPYLTFHGECISAMEFYANVFAAESPNYQTYGEYVPQGLANPPAQLGNWVMHGEMELCGSRFWFADETEPPSAGSAVKLTMTVSTAKEARHIFDALSDEGKITLPPVETFYSTFHGALVDRFGVCWNIVALELPVS